MKNTLAEQVHSTKSEVRRFGLEAPHIVHHPNAQEVPSPHRGSLDDPSHQLQVLQQQKMMTQQHPRQTQQQRSSKNLQQQPTTRLHQMNRCKNYRD